MTFELGKTYIVDVTEKGIIPQDVFDRDRWYNKDCDNLDFLTDEEKIVVINNVLDKIKAEIEELKPNNPNFKGYFEQNVALNKVLEIIDKYKAKIEK